MQSPGYVENDDDCDDQNSSINPDADEYCDDIDNNCDGNIDENSLLTQSFSTLTMTMTVLGLNRSLVVFNFQHIPILQEIVMTVILQQTHWLQSSVMT